MSSDNADIPMSDGQLRKEYEILQAKYRDLLKADNLFRKNMEERLMKAREETSASNKMTNSFLMKMGQNLKIPLNGLIGITDLIKQTELNAEQKDYLNIINNYSSKLQNKLNDMLDLARILGKDGSGKNRVFSLSKLLAELDAVYRHAAIGKSIDLQFIKDDGIPDKLIGADEWIKLISAKLLQNALDNSSNGELTFKVCLQKYDPVSVDLTIEVKDSGTGINERKADEINHLLNLKDENQVLSSEFNGLGLVFSKILCDKMNAHLGFRPNADKGSTFWLNITLSVAEENELEKTLPKTEHTEGQRILLVEDNLLNQKFAMATLRKGKHKVEIAENGKIGLEKYTSSPDAYDIILMDVQMPVMDGIEAAQKIRIFEKENKKKSIPIAAVTAYALDHDYERCMNAGMDAFLAKPYRPNELIETINKLLT